MRVGTEKMLWLPSAVLVLTSCALARPLTYYNQQGRFVSGSEADATDMASVGSLLRESRLLQPAQEASEVADLLAQPRSPRARKLSGGTESRGKTREEAEQGKLASAADGEKGYLKTSFGKGSKGYKSLDTFHTRDGDKYGFEEHEVFDVPKSAKSTKTAAKSAKQSSSKRPKDHEGAGTDTESYYEYGSPGGYYSDGGDDASSYSEDGSSESSYAGGDASGSYESFSGESSDESGSYY